MPPEDDQMGIHPVPWIVAAAGSPIHQAGGLADAGGTVRIVIIQESAIQVQ